MISALSWATSLKVLAITAILLTSSLSLGAFLATVFGISGTSFPSVPTAAFAIVGAAAFLASAAPIIEFTRIGYDFWVAVFLAVAASVASLHPCARRDTRRSARIAGRAAVS